MTAFVGCNLITANANLAEYGLDSPQFTVTVEKKDGSLSVIYIGNLSPDNSTCYVCVKGSKSVYYTTNDKFTYASWISKDFLDTSIVDVELSGIESVRFMRKSDSVDLSANCIYDETNKTISFRFNKPFEIESSSYFDRLIEHLCNLETNEYEDVTTDALINYGLSSPEFSFSLKLKDGRTFTLDFSSSRNGFYYGRLNGEGKIFRIESDRIENMESPVLVLISDYIFYDTCENIVSIECSNREKKFVIKLDVPKEKAISDPESSVTLDGRNAKISDISGRSYAAMLYESIFCINIGGVEQYANISSEAVPDTSITIIDRNHTSVVYDFYKRNDDSYYVCKNGNYTKFYVYHRELYNDGGTDTYNYGIWPAYEILTKAISDGINGIYEIPVVKETTSD